MSDKRGTSYPMSLDPFNPDDAAKLKRMGQEQVMNEMGFKLLERQKRLIAAGNKLADRALYTTREYDGLHRLASAVAEWIETVATLHLDGGKDSVDDVAKEPGAH